MICFFCHRPIRGHDITERYEWRRQGADTYVYGKGHLPLRQARGQLTRLSHNKCYHAHLKQAQLREARAADPEAQDRPDTDWRHQEQLEVGELEGDGSNRGAGAPGQ